MRKPILAFGLLTVTLLAFAVLLLPQPEPAVAAPCCSDCDAGFDACLDNCTGSNCFSTCIATWGGCFANCIECSGGGPGGGGSVGCYQAGGYCPPEYQSCVWC